jgi:transcriptional regulator with XRE-family HTH domain
MNFPERLTVLRKGRDLTQHQAAAAIGVHVSQYKRYEAGLSQPTLDVLRRTAVAFSVSADLLLFDKEERGPDDDLRFQFEAVTQFPPDEKKIVKVVLDGMILRHQARRLTSA